MSGSGFGRSSFRLSSIDIRLGLRMLVKYPTLTIVAVFALAIALPVCLAPLHIARVVESNLPEDPDGRLQLLRLVNGSTNVNDLERWRTSLGSFDRLAGVRQSSFNFEFDAGVFPVQGAEVSAAIFPMLAVAPALGRTFAKADEAAGADPVVIIGDRLWRTHSLSGGTLPACPCASPASRTASSASCPTDSTFRRVSRPGFHCATTLRRLRKQSRDVRIIGHLADRVSADSAQTEFTAVAMAGVTLEPGDERMVPEVVPTSFLMFNFRRAGSARRPSSTSRRC